jgi:ABC-type nickel/cobalt efflux system permease component RcnA
MSGDRKIDPRLISAVLVGFLAFLTSWSALAGTHHKKAGVAQARYYLYDPPHHSLPPAARPHDDHELCYLPSEGCDNNHTITN